LNGFIRNEIIKIVLTDNDISHDSTCHVKIIYY